MAVCTSCGNSIADGTMYCPHCGTPVGTPASAPPGYTPVGQGTVPPNVPPPSGYSNVNYGAAPPNAPPPAGYGPVSGATPPAAYAPAPSGTTGLEENVAGMLCYAIGWLTGIIFFFIDKRPAVRFHAAQSIVLFGGLHLLLLVLGSFFRLSMLGGLGALAGFSFVFLISSLIYLVSVVLWIVMMITAFQGKRLEIPVAVDLAKQLAGKAL